MTTNAERTFLQSTRTERKEMAKKKSKPADDVDEILDELEEEEVDEEDLEEEEDDEVDEDDDDEDEEEDDDEDDELEEEPDAKPTKRGRNAASKKSSAKRENAVAFGTEEVAELAGISGRQLRMLLRSEPELASRTDGETGRYSWKGPNDAKVKKILKRVKAGAVKEETSKRLTKVKGDKAKKGKKTSAKKSTKTTKKTTKKKKAKK